MTLWKLVLSSFRHYGKQHLGLLVGTALTSCILAGSFLVGDSVKGSLRGLASARLGQVTSSFAGGDRFFTESLADRAGEKTNQALAPIIAVHGVTKDTTTVQVLGVDQRFWALSPSGRNPFAEDDSVIAIGRPLADAIDAKVGDLLLCRVELPGMLSKDAPLSGSTENDTSIRRKIGAIIEAEDLGQFGLRNVQQPTLNFFVPLSFLQERLEKPGRVNLLLGGGDPVELAEATHTKWNLDDVELLLRQPEGEAGPWEIASGRVFVSRPVTDALMKGRQARGAITYLVNGIETPNGTAPYSMATATDEIPNEPGECTIVQWLADNMKLKLGDEISLKYLVVADAGERSEGKTNFTIGKILPMDHPQVVPGWSPKFPGVSEAENCRDWDPGIDIDLDAIRDEDEDYWDEYKGTPKVFISLSDGDQIWANRFGNRTALRFDAPDEEAASIEADFKERVTVNQFGFETRDLAAEARNSVDKSLNLGMYFGYFAFFLVLASLLLSALLFLFTAESRSQQIGVMRSIGMSGSQVQRSLLFEGAVVAVVGSALGLLGGLLYTKLALQGLGGIWSEAVNGMRFSFHANPISLIGAFLGSVLAALAALWFATRALFKIAPKDLVAGSGTGIALQKSYRPKSGSWIRSLSLWLSVLSLIGGLAVLALARQAPGETAGLAFAGAGALLLIAGIALLAFLLRFLDQGGDFVESTAALGRRNAVRRRGRSLAVAALMASGVFLVAAVNAFRLDSRHAEGRRDSGTGGFALVADSSLPIYEKIDSPAGMDAFGLEKEDLEGVSVVPLRVGKGEDASCLNLNRAQRPLLVGVDPSQLAEREAFIFKSSMNEDPSRSPWLELDTRYKDSDLIPGIVDFNTAAYAMGGKKLGDEVEYQDDNGKVFRVKLVGMLGGSMLQGRLLISEENFVERHPTAAGYRSFLFDAPEERTGDLVDLLGRMLGKRGFQAESAVARLDAYNAVQNGYLGIFTVLGGLGVLLGTVGLGVLVLRNVGERRGEIGVLQAIGLGRGGVLRMLLGENVFLLVGGLIVGLVAAIVAVWPQFRDPASELPLGFLFGLAGAILVTGLVFCALAGWGALRRPLIESIRSE